MNFNDVLLNHYIQNIIIPKYHQYKNMNELFCILSLVPSLKSGVYFLITAHLHLD
jgi:hypothetical protein